MKKETTKKCTFVFLIPSLRPGGAERNCIRIANEFYRKGHHVSIWIRERSPNDLAESVDKNVEVHVLGGGGFLSTSIRIVKKLLQSELDSILVFNYFHLVPVVFVKALFSKNFRIVYRIISSLSVKTSTEGSKLQQWFSKVIVRTFAPFTDQIIAQCEGMRQDAAKFLMIAPQRIVTIYNPAPDVDVDGDDTHRSHEILFVGRLAPVKGIDYLLKAFRELCRYDSKINLRIVGNGSLLEDLRQKVDGMNLKDRVFFEGFQANPSPYFKRAKITVLTSLREGFPNVLVESISYGTPVISFDCPTGPSEIIVENLNGFLVPHLDVRKLTEAFLTVLNTDFDYTAIKNSSKKFHIDTISIQYLEACMPMKKGL
jgi:glycosyltransferase involved in cell wall biosynthesis